MSTPANPTPHPLDAAARDELARKAEAARDAWNEYANPSSRPANDTRMDYLVARDEFKNACSPDVILALLAAVERGEADTARIDALAANPDKLVCVRSYSTESRLNEWFVLGAHRKGQTTDIREALDNLAAFYPAARAHPPIQETDDA